MCFMYFVTVNLVVGSLHETNLGRTGIVCVFKLLCLRAPPPPLTSVVLNSFLKFRCYKLDARELIAPLITGISHQIRQIQTNGYFNHSSLGFVIGFVKP